MWISKMIKLVYVIKRRLINQGARCWWVLWWWCGEQHSPVFSFPWRSIRAHCLDDFVKITRILLNNNYSITRRDFRCNISPYVHHLSSCKSSDESACVSRPTRYIQPVVTLKGVSFVVFWYWCSTCATQSARHAITKGHSHLGKR